MLRVLHLISLFASSNGFFHIVGQVPLCSQARARLPLLFRNSGASHQIKTQAISLGTAPLGREEGIDVDHCRLHLEKDMLSDLARVAKRFSEYVTSLERIQSLHVSSLDGDSMHLEVVYCEESHDSCFALDVPVIFPHHCDTEAEVDEAIHELEVLADEDISELSARGDGKPAWGEDMQQIIDSISAIMNEVSFQDELVKMVAMFGRRQLPAGASIRSCELMGLTPHGFTLSVRVHEEEHEGVLFAVPIKFARDCTTAFDFQEQILELAEMAGTAGRTSAQ